MKRAASVPDNRQPAMKTVILGATSGMGRALARELVAQGHSLFLLGRRADELERSVADLNIRREGSALGFAHCDLEVPDTFEPAISAAQSALEGFDIAIITAGLFATQEQLESDLELARRVLTVNHAHTVLLCERLKTALLANKGGTLVVFSSVAGDRGRKPVGLYGSSKAGLSHYLESLDHKYRSQGLVTVSVKPGFVKTGATAQLRPPPFAGTPEGVARDVARAIERGRPLLYTPWVWRWIMALIRRLPRSVMRQINF